MAIETELEAFFVKYIHAFQRNDPDSITELWEPVGLFPTPTGNFAMERDAFRDHCKGLLDFYRTQGVTTPKGELLSAEELFPNVAQTRMAYRMLGADGAVIAEWQHVCILRKSDTWRVSLTLADDELAAWTARGAAL